MGSFEEVTRMGHPRFSSEEIERRGKELYEKGIRARVETPENIGKLVSIDVETGDYEIGDDTTIDAPRSVVTCAGAPDGIAPGQSNAARLTAARWDE